MKQCVVWLLAFTAFMYQLILLNKMAIRETIHAEIIDIPSGHATKLNLGHTHTESLSLILT